MKIALIVLGLLVLLVLVVVGVGALLPKHHVSTRSAHFKASAAQLFTLIAGPQNWRPDVAKSEEISDPGGRRLQQETNQRGEIITYELLNVDPPHGIVRKIVTPNLPYSGSWTFVLTPTDGGTNVRITEDGEVYNPIFRFVSRFVLGQTATIDTYLKAMGSAVKEPVAITG